MGSVSVAADHGVSSQNFRHWSDEASVLIEFWAELSQDTLNPATDHLPKKLTMVVKAKGGHVEFRLN